MKPSFKPISGAILFALLVIASSYFLKGTPFRDWVDAGIYLTGIYFACRYFTTSNKVCVTK